MEQLHTTFLMFMKLVTTCEFRNARDAAGEFLKQWGRATAESRECSPPKWRNNCMERLFAERSEKNNIAADRKRWMKVTSQKLKIAGTPDSRIRQVICSHLPYGSGPYDRYKVRSLTDGVEMLL